MATKKEPAKEQAQATPPALSTKLIITLALVVVVAVGASVGITVALVGGDNPSATAADGDEPEDADEDAAEQDEAESIYIALDPAFVINFQDREGRSKFLKAELSVVTRDPKMQAAIAKHMPAIRNNLVLLFSRQIYDDLVPHEGKEKLRAEALAEVQSVLEENTGDSGVDELFFSSLVMQ